MTTTQNHPVQAPARPDRRRTARVALLAALVVNVLIVAALVVATGASPNILITLGRIFGLVAGLLMAGQFLLIARLPWLDQRLGMDRLTTYHRWNGIGLMWTLLGHVVLIVSGYAQHDAHDVISEVFVLSDTFTGVLLAIIAFLLVVVVGATSARIARKRLPYETWHAIHLLTYAIVALAFTHQFISGTTIASTGGRIYWLLLWATAIGTLLTGRVIRPLLRNHRYQLRVAGIVHESPNVVSVYVSGRNLHELPARAGQFFVWRFLAKGMWHRANPFSLSAAPDGRYLRLTVKAVGTASAALRDLKVGTRVYAEGPYGAFTTANQVHQHALLIAGGVGVTPIRALLEEIKGHVVVLYRVRDERDAVLLDELRALAPVVRVLGGPSAGQFNPESLRYLVPDIRARDVFVCGPAAMTNAVLASTRALQVPDRQVHAEKFSLAG
ncbi:ferredoxin reductase family protein [Kutzneria sp. 744]|uniref:ferredoxin reductase family protein n=1 Tax=Kutzneria sp. (strain 744) TaxID=345341 RepID=UPI0005BB23B3